MVEYVNLNILFYKILIAKKEKVKKKENSVRPGTSNDVFFTI